MIECIRQTIDPSFIPEDQHLLLGDNMKCDVIASQTQSYILCEFDRKNQNYKVFPFFNATVKGLVCMCDYILFWEREDRLLVLLIELKSSSSPLRQLDQTEPFAKFICDKCKLVFGDRWTKRYTIMKMGINKSNTTKRPTQGYKLEDDNGVLCWPNPQRLKLSMLSKMGY